MSDKKPASNDRKFLKRFAARQISDRLSELAGIPKFTDREVDAAMKAMSVSVFREEEKNCAEFHEGIDENNAFDEFDKALSDGREPTIPKPNPLKFNEYSEQALSTAIYPERGKNPYYPVLGLCGEAGEVAEKMKKVFRDNDGKIDLKTKLSIAKELGDVLWYVSALADEIGVPLEDIARMNLEKLQSRMERKKLKGEGDER